LILTLVVTNINLITGSIARSASRRYLVYSEADFEVFAPQGRHVAPMGVTFGVEEGTEGRLLRAKFHPICAIIQRLFWQRHGCRTPKTEIFNQI